MPSQRVLIAVDSEPVAAHAADVGIELARKLEAEVAFVYVVDPKSDFAPESGISAISCRSPPQRCQKSCWPSFVDI